MFTLVISEAEQQVFEGHAKIVNVPTRNGMEGILTNHAPMVDVIVDGVMSYEDENGERYELTVSQGYLFVWNNMVTIFVNSTEFLSEINLEQAQAEVEKQQQILATSSDKLEIAEAEIRLNKNMNRIKAVSNRK